VKKQRKRAVRDADEPREQTAEATADADAEPEAEAGLEDATGPDGDAEPAEDAEA
jgi:hypothetical protein